MLLTCNMIRLTTVCGILASKAGAVKEPSLSQFLLSCSPEDIWETIFLRGWLEIFRIMLTHVCHHVDFTKLIVADKSNLIQHKYQKWFGNIDFQISTYAAGERCSGWRGSPLPWLALWLAPNHISFSTIKPTNQPSNIKPSWSNEYLILFRFDTSSESPYIRFLVLVIQVWFIRLQNIHL